MSAARDDGWAEVPPVDGPTTYQFDSPLVGDRLEVTVAVPPAYESNRELVLTLYALDPFHTLDMVVGVSRLFGRVSAGYVPQTLVVGVGYPTRDRSEFQARRARNLTPTDAPLPPGIPNRPPYGLDAAPMCVSGL